MLLRVGFSVVVALFVGADMALAQQAPPPPPSAGTTVPGVTPGLTANLADATRLIQNGEYSSARAKIDAALATDAKNAQARFLLGVVESDEGDSELALVTFQTLAEDFPELPEPYNNLAVIWAQRGQYEKARLALESALRANPDYAIAHENLGDIYSRLAGAEYDRAVAIDKTNKSAQSKLVLVRELYAVAPSSNAPVLVAPSPKPAATSKPKK
jgi:tetratricopeptide (TPR) repeat protein